MLARVAWLALVLAGVGAARAAATFEIYYLPIIGTPPAGFPTGAAPADAEVSSASTVDDYPVADVQLPFNFSYFGQKYDAIFVGANGIVQFDDKPLANSSRFYPFAGVDMSATILPFFTDLNPSSPSPGDRIKVVVGAEAVDVYFTNVPLFDCDDSDFDVSFTLRLSWTGRIQCYYRALPPSPVDLSHVEANNVCRAQRKLVTIGIVPPKEDSRLGVRNALVPEQTEVGVNVVNESGIYSPPWTQRTEGVYIERRVTVLDQANTSVVLRMENGGVRTVDEVGYFWDLCPISNSFCLQEVSAAALGGDPIASTDVSGSVVWTFAEFGCNPADLEVECAFQATATPGDASLYADLTEVAAFAGTADDPTSLFSRNLACDFPSGLRYDTEYNVTLVYRYAQNQTTRGADFSERRSLPGSSNTTLLIDVSGANTAAAPTICDACGRADATPEDLCFGQCGTVYSVFDCEGLCTFEIVEDDRGACCKMECIGHCADGLCCAPPGCDGICNSFTNDSSCFGLSAGAGVVAADAPDLSFFDVPAGEESAAPFQVSSDGPEGVAAVLNISGPVNVEVAKPIFNFPASLATGFGANVMVHYNVSYADRFELVTDGPVNITGPATVSVLAELVWPNATQEADLVQLFTSASITVPAALAGNFPSQSKDVTVPFLVYLQSGVCDSVSRARTCAWAPGCFMCSLIRGGRRRVAPISKQRRRLTLVEPERGEHQSDRRLSLGIFPEAIVAEPDDEELAGGLCFAGLDVGRCDEILLELEADPSGFDDARLEP